MEPGNEFIIRTVSLRYNLTLGELLHQNVCVPSISDMALNSCSSTTVSYLISFKAFQ